MDAPKPDCARKPRKHFRPVASSLSLSRTWFARFSRYRGRDESGFAIATPLSRRNKQRTLTTSAYVARGVITPRIKRALARRKKRKSENRRTATVVGSNLTYGTSSSTPCTPLNPPFLVPSIRAAPGSLAIRRCNRSCLDQPNLYTEIRSFIYSYVGFPTLEMIKGLLISIESKK